MIQQNQLRDAILQNRMSQSQYLKMLEKEIQKINQKIDLKILQGEAYFKEARDHKLLLKKVRYHTRRSFFSRVFPGLAKFSF
ncbi:hypothetical protein HY311_01180 [Candidatus Nomurabacteria bacterium]|nr:hypothetical protein [Candidatus Nomurabacteria bacterium]